MAESALEAQSVHLHENGAITPVGSWPEFERSLAQVLPGLDGKFLILEVMGSSRYVQLHVSGSSGVHAEAVSNVFLEGTERLDDAAVDRLLSLGWLLPVPRAGGPPSPPNFHRDFPIPVPFEEVARLVVRTFTEIHGVEDPVVLAYSSFAPEGVPVTLPALGIFSMEPPRPRAAPPEAASPEPSAPGLAPAGVLREVRRRVLAAAQALAGDESLAFDDDGDVPLLLGNHVGFARVIPRPFLVRLWCVLAPRLEPSEQVLRTVLQEGARLPLVRLVFTGGTLFAAVELPAAPFAPEHFEQARLALAVAARDLVPAFRVGASA